MLKLASSERTKMERQILQQKEEIEKLEKELRTERSLDRVPVF